MTAAASQAGTAPGAASVVPFFSHLSPQILRVLVDFEKTVTYRQGTFHRRTRVIGGPPGPGTPLDATAMQGLLAGPNTLRQQLPAGVDARAQQSIIEISSDVLSAIDGGHPPLAPGAP
jgi:hypothetical protein